MTGFEKCVQRLMEGFAQACAKADAERQWREERFFFHLARISKPPVTEVTGE